MVTFDDVIPEAVALARRWLAATAHDETPTERRSTRRLASLVADPDGLELALRFVDRVARPRDPRVAAHELAALGRAGLHPAFLGPADRVLLGAGSRLAPLAPRLAVPAAHARMRQMIGHLVADATHLGPQLSRLRGGGFHVNVNLLGEAVLGEAEAASRAARLRTLVAREDVDHVSVKVSALVPQIVTWDLDGSRTRVLKRLRPLARAASAHGTHLALDMEEYRDLTLTLGVVAELADDPGLRDLRLGVALQAYLPDSRAALEEVLHLSRRREAAGGRPLRVRLVKGANLAMERVEAELHGWEQTVYPTKAEVDASYLDLLDLALTPGLGLRVGVASHNLFHVAAAHLLATERGEAARMEVEMLHGMAPAQARAVRAETGRVLLYVPAVDPADLDVAVGYLVRRLEENAAPQNFLHAMTAGAAALDAQEAAFRAAVAAAPTVDRTPRRLRAPAGAPSGADVPSPTASATDAPPTRGSESYTRVETRVYDSEPRVGVEDQDRDPTGGAELEFWNVPDLDPALAVVRERAARMRDGSAPPAEPAPLVPVTSTAAADAVVARAVEVGATWAAVPPGARGAALRRAAELLEERRDAIAQTAVAEAGKTVAEIDPEISEAIDLARWYAGSAERLDPDHEDADPDAVHRPWGVTLVTPPWNFPVAIPLGSALASLAAGSPALLKPSHLTPLSAAMAAGAVRDALAERGHAPDVLQVLDVAGSGEADVGSHLVRHPDVARVLLTGSLATARLFARMRPGLDVLAETSGKNAMIVTPSADVDLAVADTVRSAFGHAGQKCSAASLLVLVGSAGTDDRLRSQLADAVTSLAVGPATDAGTVMGPLTPVADGDLLRALTTLEPGESWLVEPRRLDDAGRAWTPGVRYDVRPGSWFARTEAFGPVLGVVRVPTLDDAIAVVNSVDLGLTSGLHSLDDDEIDRWTERVEAGNLYVNRHTTGAIVRRQPFGGWKASVVGPGAKAGGPHYVAQIGTWADAPDVPDRETAPGAWLARAGESDARWWREQFSREHDPSGLTVESNVLRYRPLPHATVRVGPGALAVEVTRVLAAAERCGVPVDVSVDPGVVRGGVGAAGVERSRAPADAGHGTAPGDAGADGAYLDLVLPGDARVEDAASFASRVAAGDVDGRVRVVGRSPGLREAAASRTGFVTVLDAPVVASGGRELLAFLREQAVSRTRHRYGHVEPR
ncbi:proline dehydrogenase family protein [Flavimobilis sp. GY10621]|uniref:L-glutamate gamma-semialdehyde dehydrogenase n=1 Tax=Flavimobilis rhizosphaerae TaxID=2775421 RepID=A0ABR9DM96_9MICO|nr:proline dehydrogenase family protein [Flavimobilis rhizosphaerae]MBD9698024.1 proline dehydrogenase family protein [Flavimobilis rhizosphaerae]